ncbi:energy transducer TonB [Sphingomonas crusticola]|uniref:energy transducer TonB n=1 Tax=Sphingomonas crusticola TaxID=1697973 RepID=UPI0013C34E6F|nr:energy transducer TonB [Sphingomonas crusticola]
MARTRYWPGLPALALALASAARSQDAAPAWPDVAPQRVRETPDWSDYHTYPPAARRRNQEGRVVAALRVDPAGIPAECRIETSSGHPELDAGTCELMMSMRFDPAQGADGKPIFSTFRRGMRWILGDPRPFASSALEARLQLERGELRQCEISQASGAYVALWSMTACSFFRDTAHYLGAHATTAQAATIAVRLDAGDQDPLLNAPWPSGQLIAQQRVTFTVNKEGDPSDCQTVEDRGFGPKGLNTLASCGRLLSDLWLKKATGRQGTFETRVYLSPASDLPPAR